MLLFSCLNSSMSRLCGQTKQYSSPQSFLQVFSFQTFQFPHVKQCFRTLCRENRKGTREIPKELRSCISDRLPPTTGTTLSTEVVEEPTLLCKPTLFCSKKHFLVNFFPHLYLPKILFFYTIMRYELVLTVQGINIGIVDCSVKTPTRVRCQWGKEKSQIS